MLELMDYSKLDLTNNFVFSKVMLNKSLCKRLLEIILDIEIFDISYPEEEKSIDLAIDSRAVRLDVYVRDDKNTVYNIEMQTTNPGNLPKRSRYYQTMIDLNLIDKGADFNKLNRGIVIFICKQDIFKRGKCKYTFKNLCVEEEGLELGDETTKIFINPKGKTELETEELRNFLTFLSNKQTNDTFTKSLEHEIIEVLSNEKWRHEYMTLYIREQEKYNEGLEQGIQQGILQGEQQGEQQAVRKLVREMFNKGMSKEVIRSIVGEDMLSEAKLNEIFMESGINNKD